MSTPKRKLSHNPLDPGHRLKLRTPAKDKLAAGLTGTRDAQQQPSSQTQPQSQQQQQQPVQSIPSQSQQQPQPQQQAQPHQASPAQAAPRQGPYVQPQFGPRAFGTSFLFQGLLFGAGEMAGSQMAKNATDAMTASKSATAVEDVKALQPHTEPAGEQPCSHGCDLGAHNFLNVTHIHHHDSV